MHSYVITDSRDSFLGMQLAGIKGIYLKSPEAIEQAFKKAVRDPDIGIVYMTEKAFEMIRDTVEAYKRKHLFPLITEIPDRYGYEDDGQPGLVSRYIRESLGL